MFLDLVVFTILILNHDQALARICCYSFTGKTLIISHFCHTGIRGDIISGLEAGAFDIDENDNAISHSNDTATKPYENKNINKLLKDIAKHKDVNIEAYD
jgi:hypothetical protein